MKIQSAMEYLTTYGWAILIIGISLAALFELGVFNPLNYAAKATPGSCSVNRPQGPNTTEQLSLSGVCTNLMPQYVAVFSGTSGNVIISRMSEIAPNSGDGMTITMWVKIPKTNVFGGVALAAGYGNTQIGWGTEFSPFNPPGWITSSTAAQANTWTFIATTAVVGGQGQIYVNGVQTATGSAGSGTIGIAPLSIGAGGCCGSEGLKYLYNGSMSNVQVYDTALSANSISALYAEGIGGAPIDLQHIVGWWPLNGNANDYSGNGNNGQAYSVSYVSNWWGGYTAP